MKSRLLPPPQTEDEELKFDSSPWEFVRRSTDKSPNLPATEPSPAQPEQAMPEVEPYEPAPSSAPQVSARPKGRFFMVSVLLICIGFISFMLWSTFLRDAAFGVVTGNVTAISAPWAGTLTALHVRIGDTVRQGDLLAVVDDPELQASIDRLGDELRAAQAELDAQVALLALAARQRNNDTGKIRAEYYDLRGELLAEQSRYEQLESQLKRSQELVNHRAVSDEKIESLHLEKTGLMAKIENLTQAVDTLATQLENLPDDDHNTAQLQPQLAKIENYQAEIRRLRDRQQRGTLRAPMDGTVVSLAGHTGEYTAPEQPLLELLPAGALELVLYVKQADINDYRVGQQTELVVDPAPEPLACRVTHIGQRFEKPQSHIVGRYAPEEKLLPIYLEPLTPLPPDSPLHLGSMIREPASLFGF